jgi:hypothetical protein
LVAIELWIVWRALTKLDGGVKHTAACAGLTLAGGLVELGAIGAGQAGDASGDGELRGAVKTVAIVDVEACTLRAVLARLGSPVVEAHGWTWNACTVVQHGSLKGTLALVGGEVENGAIRT